MLNFQMLKRTNSVATKKNTIFDETYAKTKDGKKIIVACRPEGRDEELYVNDIANCC